MSNAMRDSELEYLATLVALEKISSEAILAKVDSLVNQGEYADEFIEMWESKPPLLRDVLPPFVAYLTRREIAIPSKDEDVWQAIHHHCLLIVDNCPDPLAELSRMIREVYFHVESEKFVGDSHGVENLVGIYWSQDDLDFLDLPPIGLREKFREIFSPRPTKEEVLQELARDAVQAAKDWLSKYENRIGSR